MEKSTADFLEGVPTPIGRAALIAARVAQEPHSRLIEEDVRRMRDCRQPLYSQAIFGLETPNRQVQARVLAALKQWAGMGIGVELVRLAPHQDSKVGWPDDYPSSAVESLY